MPDAAPPPDRPEAGPPVRLGISSCLLGENVRATGGHCRDRFLVEQIGPWVSWVPVCPEVEVGMPTPRPTIRLVGDVEDPRLVTSDGETDHTDAMRAYAAERVEALAGADLDGYVFKKSSPSCGLFRVRVYGESGMPSRKGRGLFAHALTDRLPLLPVEEDGRLNDPRLRENFIERIFAHARWRRLRRTATGPGDLVRFHTGEKLALLAHDPEAYRRLGRLVAQAGDHELEGLLDAYGALYMETLRTIARPGRHANVMEHLLGFLRDELDAYDRKELVELIHTYRRGLVPLVVPLTLLRHHIGRGDVPDWVHQQVYLNPYPRELMLRNHV